MSLPQLPNFDALLASFVRTSAREGIRRLALLLMRDVGVACTDAECLAFNPVTGGH